VTTEESCVIVGAGLAGGNAAVAARENGFTGRIILIGAEADPPYNRPPLSKGYLRGEEQFDEVRSRPDGEYNKQGVELRTGVQAVAIDAGSKTVRLADGDEVKYTSLVVATGGRNRRPKIPGIDLDGVLQLRARADSDRIRDAARTAGPAVVVGLGFIGSEVAASLRTIGCEVTAIEAEKWPLARVLGEDVGQRLAAMHRSNGVELVLGDGVEAFEGDGGKLNAVRTKSGKRLPCGFAVVGLGIEPELGLLEAAGAKLDNGVLVDEFCRTSIPGVVAAGDCANRHHPLFERRMRLEHWNNADRMGTVAGANVAGKKQAFDDVPSFWSDQYQEKIEYVGHHDRFDRLVFRGDVAGRHFFGFYIAADIVQAVVTMGYSDDIVEPLEKLIRYRKPIPDNRLADERAGFEELTSPQPRS